MRVEQTKKRRAPEGCSPYQCMVEARRIELRSILDRPSGSTSLVNDKNSAPPCPLTDEAEPSQFNLFLGHTDYVPRSIPLS